MIPTDAHVHEGRSLPPQLRFDGRVAIVTGAGRGLGRAHALLLAARGAAVVVNDLGAALRGGGEDAGPAEEVATEIRAAGGSAVASTGDVATEKGAASIVEAALASFGRLDIVINNAGIIRWEPLADTDLASLNAHLAVHAGGSLNVTKAAWPHLAAQGYGRVVMTTSGAIFGDAGIVAYSAAKGAIVGLANSLAQAGAGLGIKVNVVCPAALTRMTPTTDEPNRAAQRADALGTGPVAAVVAYLAHESCEPSGEIYSAAGGRVARVFLGETDGITVQDLTPEDVRDHRAEIADPAGFSIPSGTVDYIARRRVFLSRARGEAGAQ